MLPLATRPCRASGRDFWPISPHPITLTVELTDT
jgi:hypothetical protein